MSRVALFPRHDIDPSQKGEDWLRQCGEAIWAEHESTPHKIFHKKKSEYDLLQLYAMGKQPTDKYKVLVLGKDKAKDEDSLMAIDWAVRPIIPKMLHIACSKVMERQYNFTCTPIDPMAKDEAEQYYAEAKIKIMQRKAALQADPSLAQNPAFMKEVGDPEDMEELEMSMEFGPKIKRAMDAEMLIQLIMYQNEYEMIRDEIVMDLVKFGVAGAKDYIDENAEIKLRKKMVDRVLMSNCKRRDFKDRSYDAELIEVPLSQLAAKFNKEELREIANHATNKDQYPQHSSEFNDEFDPFKVNVLDFEIRTYNTTMYKNRVDRRGNLVTRKEKTFMKEKTVNPKSIKLDDEKEIPEYETSEREVLYKGKWIVGTKYLYDYGPITDSKRTLQNKAATEMSSHFQAYDFFNMEAASFLERIIPIADEYQVSIYKIQNFKNKWIPYIIEIDYDSLESVAWGKGGKKLTPKDLVDMVYQQFMLITRKNDISKQNPNHKAVDVKATAMHNELTVLVNDLARLLSEMRDVLGLNEVTDGSSPNPNMLNYVASLGESGTNNALRPVMMAEKRLGESLAKGILLRAQKIVKKKRIEGMVPALGSETMKFFSFGEDIAMHDWGIMVQDRPTVQERQMLLQNLNLKGQNGQINADDYLLIQETQNLKQAAKLLAYRQKKREEQAREWEAQKIKMTTDGQKESAMVSEQMKQQTLQVEYQLKGGLELQLKAMDMEIAKGKNETDMYVADRNAESKIAATTITAASKAESDKEEPSGSEKK